jgi:hypothetical protein
MYLVRHVFFTYNIYSLYLLIIRVENSETNYFNVDTFSSVFWTLVFYNCEYGISIFREFYSLTWYFYVYISFQGLLSQT